jgi:hypothetical protein
MRIEINFVNKDGEVFNTSRHVDDSIHTETEVAFLHDSYKAFLNNFGYPVDYDEKIGILGEDELGEYCNNDYETCEEDEDEKFYDVDAFVDIIADKVIDKIFE